MHLSLFCSDANCLGLARTIYIMYTVYARTHTLIRLKYMVLANPTIVARVHVPRKEEENENERRSVHSDV